MLEGLDAVAWEELGHAYGRATDVPDLLRALLDQETSAAALDNLHAAICHQGTVYSASAAAVPFLVELARNPAVPDRSRILGLLADIGWMPPGFHDDLANQHPGFWQTESADLAQEMLEEHREWMAAVEAAHTALAGAVPGLLGLLGDPEVGVRRMAVYALKRCFERSAEIVAALRRRLDDEPDEATRGCAVLAAGELAGAGGLGLEAVRDWLTGLLDAPPAVRLAAGVAWAQASAEELPTPVLAAMTSALRDSIAVYHGNIPWIDDDWPYLVGVEEGGLAGWVARKLERQPTSRTALVRVLMSHRSDSEIRRLTVRAAGALIAEWRSPTDEVVATFGTLLADPDPQVRWVTLEQLINVGPPAAVVADALVAVDRQRTPRAAALAHTALANCGDARCLPAVAELLKAPRNLERLRLDALGPAAAGVLVPAIRRLLARPWDSGLPLMLRSSVVEQLGRWGPVSAPAVPELVTLVQGSSPNWEACLALGGIGPAAAAAVPALRRAVEGSEASVVAAWALWRVAGDATTALRVLGDALAGTRSEWAGRLLADLGPAAAGLAARLRQVALGDGPPDTRVHAAFALWRVTGDTQTALPVLLAWFGPLTDPAQRPTDDQIIEYLRELRESDSLQVIEYLGKIGPPAHAAVPMLRAILRSDRRVRFQFTGEKEAIVVDERCQRAAAVALDRILGDSQASSTSTGCGSFSGSS